MRAEEIIKKYFFSKIDRNTSVLFQEWYLFPKDKKLKEKTLEKLWKEVPFEHALNLDQAFSRVENKISQQSKNYRKKFLAIAAAVLLLILPTATLLYFFSNNTSEVVQTINMKKCFAKNGEIAHFKLPDSSVVILNSNSFLVYPERFEGDTRKVFLYGEGVFKVEKNIEQPFIVETYGMDIKVLGTTFNLCAYPEDENISATLLTGSILAVTETQEEYILEGECLSYNTASGEVSKTKVSANDAIAWSEGKIIMYKSPMWEVINKIERQFEMRVHLTSSKYKNEVITAKFIHGESIYEVMAALRELIPGMKYKIETNSIYIY